MVTIKGASAKPCFVCGKKERTVEVRFADGSFRGVLCLEDIYKKLPVPPTAESEEEREQRST